MCYNLELIIVDDDQSVDYQRANWDAPKPSVVSS